MSDSKENRVTRQVRIYTDMADWLDAECVRLRSIHGRKFVPAEVADLIWKSGPSADKKPEGTGSAPKAQQGDSSPLGELTPEELSLVSGLVAGWRVRDVIISGAVQMLKARITEKGYELKREAAGKREEHTRRKVAG